MRTRGAHGRDGRRALHFGCAAATVGALAAVFLAVTAAPQLARADACRDSLLAAGRVRLEPYELRDPSHPHGSTTYHFDQRNSYRFTFRQQDAGDSVRVTVEPHATIAIAPWHEVVLPSGVPDTTGWYRRLESHQFDYLAISADPRPVLLIRHLVEHLPPLSRTLPRGAPLTSAIASRLIDDAIASRYGAVVRQVQRAYDRLDSLTAHGEAPLPDRDAFFERLYTFDELAREGFPYTIEAAGLLADTSYTSAPRPCHLAGTR